MAEINIIKFFKKKVNYLKNMLCYKSSKGISNIKKNEGNDNNKSEENDNNKSEGNDDNKSEGNDDNKSEGNDDNKSEGNDDNKINNINTDKYIDTESNINIIMDNSTQSIKQYSKDNICYYLDYSISQKNNNDDKIMLIRKYKFVQDESVIKNDN